jgi:hypothetical protein
MPMSSASLTIMSSTGVNTLSERDGFLISAGHHCHPGQSRRWAEVVAFLLSHPRLARCGYTGGSQGKPFGMCRKRFMLEIGAAWGPSSKAERDVHRQWASGLSRALAPFAVHGGYAIFLTPDDHEQIGSAYGGNASRLGGQATVRSRQCLFISDTALRLLIHLPVH